MIIAPPTRTFWIKSARWMATVLSVPAAWAGGLWLDALIHARALRLLCAEDQVFDTCPHTWFEATDATALAIGVACAAVAAMGATYLLAPDARLVAMWCAFAFCALAAFLLLAPLVAFPVTALAAMVGVVITWRSWRRDHVMVAYQTTHPNSDF